MDDKAYNQLFALQILALATFMFRGSPRAMRSVALAQELVLTKWDDIWAIVENDPQLKALFQSGPTATVEDDLATLLERAGFVKQ